MNKQYRTTLLSLLVISMFLITACTPSASTTGSTIDEFVEKTFCVPNPWGDMSETSMTITAFHAYEYDGFSTTSTEWVKVEKVEASETATDIMWRDDPDMRSDDPNTAPYIATLNMADGHVGLDCGDVSLTLDATEGDTFQVTVIPWEGSIKEISRWSFAADGRWYAVDPQTYVEGKTECEDNTYYVSEDDEGHFIASSKAEDFLSSDLANMATGPLGLIIFCDDPHSGRTVWSQNNSLVAVSNGGDWFPWVVQERWYLHDDGASRVYYNVP